MPEITPLKMSRPVALQIIRSAAADSRVVLLRHAKQRMVQRRISATRVLSCLLRGVITEGPAQDLRGYWRCTMERLAAGEEVKVVVSFNSRERVLIISVM
jgi:hypothetical protein